jgi:hypothetical protein
MKGMYVKTLMANAIVCTALLASEISGVSFWSNQDGFDVAPEPQPTIEQTAARPMPYRAELVDQLAARAVARPLFSPTRRPPSPPAVQGRIRAEPPRLSGVLSWPGGNSAIFQSDKAPHPTIVGEGSTLGEWTVQTIAAGTVTVSRGDERLLLHPSFADAPAAEVPEPRQAQLRARDQWGHHIRPPDYLERRG